MMDKENMDSNCFIHKIDYYIYRNKVFGIIPTMDKVFIPRKECNYPTSIISKEKPIFHKSYKRKQRIKRVFVLTSACNLQCSYCFEGNHISKQKFDADKLKLCIEEMFNESVLSNKKLISFSLFGGEPSMNWKAIETAVSVAKDLEKKTGIKCYKAIVTNGVMPISHIQYLASNMDFVYFSLDGPKELFLKQRKPSGGSDVYDIIFRNAKEVYEKGTYLAFKVTVTKLTIEYLKEIDDFFAYNFPTCSRLYQPCMVDENSELYISFGKFLRKYLELKRYSVFSKNLTTSLYKNKPSDRFCNLTIRNVVYPDGSVLACHRSNMCVPEDDVKKEFKVGYCDDNGIIHRDNKKQQYLEKFTVNQINQCSTCPLKYHCCGGCATIKLLSGSKDMFRKADYCEDFMKFAYTDILSRLFQDEEEFLNYLPQKIFVTDNEMEENDFKNYVVERMITIEE